MNVAEGAEPRSMYYVPSYEGVFLRVFEIVIASHIHSIFVATFVIFHLLNCFFHQILLMNDLKEDFEKLK